MANSESNFWQRVARLLARKSLAGTLQLLTGAVIAIIIVIFGVSYAWLSNEISHADRLGSSTNYGRTRRACLRGRSAGRLCAGRESLRDSALPPFICGVHVLTPGGKAIASVDNTHSERCHNPRDLLSLSFPIQTAETLGAGGSRKQGDVVLSGGKQMISESRPYALMFAAVLGGFSIFFLLLMLNRISVDLALTPLRESVLAVASSPNIEDTLGNDEYAGFWRQAHRARSNLCSKNLEVSTVDMPRWPATFARAKWPAR